MPLKLTGGKSLIDPRLDGYRTVFGAAFSTFMKIRTEMNLMIWKYRLKYADPSALIKREGELENRIETLHKMKADLAGKELAERQKIVNKYLERRTAIHVAMIRGTVSLQKEDAKVYGDALKVSQAWLRTNAPKEATAQVDATMRSLKSEISDYMEMTRRKRSGGGIFGAIKDEDLLQKSRSIAVKYAEGLKEAANIAAGRNAWIADEKLWLYAYNTPVEFLNQLKEDAHRHAKDQGLSKEAANRIAADYDRLADDFKIQTNKARWPGTEKDILHEHLKSQKVWGISIEMKHKMLGSMLDIGDDPYGMSSEEMTKFVEGQITTKPQQEAIQRTIDALMQRRLGLGVRRAEKEAERERLLSGGGMNIAIDPYSKRPSRLSSRLGAFGSMYKAEPSLVEAVGGRTGAMTFPPGEGGNLSDFLKAKIGEYREGETVEADDSPYFKSIMDQVVKAVDLYGDALSSSDAAFSNPQELAQMGTVKSVKDLVEGYRAYQPKAKVFMAKSTLSALSEGDSAITRDYGVIQRRAEPDSARSREAAYNASIYLARTNVSVVLNPRIERIMDAREAGDREAMYREMQSLYDLVSDPSLDDLLGSAGQNIRGMFDDVETSSSAIGGDAAVDRAAEHLEQQYIALAEQRTQQDPGTYGSVTNG